MGVINYDQESESIEIQYGGRENPFSGIDSSAPDPYISPGGQEQSSANSLVIDNSIRAISFVQEANYGFSSTSVTIGIGDLLGAVFSISYDTATQLISVYTYPNFPAGPQTLVGTIAIPNYSNSSPTPTPGLNTLCFKNINGVCFFSFIGCPYILQHNNVSVGILTSYLGCAYLNELNGRLVAADIFQFQGGSGGGTVVNGSGPSSATATQSGSGTNTQDGSAITFAATPVTGSVVIKCNFFGSANWFQGGSSMFAQISIDSGVTWNTFYSWSSTGTTGSASPNFPGITTTISSGLTNLSTLQLRVMCIAAAGGSGNASMNGTLNASTATLSGSSSPGIIIEYPYQFAWSAATQQYGQWSPLDTNNLVTGAGFNNLPDVEDTITGYFNIGPTGYIIRSQGITEVSPLNSGINPFDFNHLWASHKGIGTVYPTTLAQYGSVGVFLSDTGIYTIGYEGINVIDNKAKSAIYDELIILNGANLLYAGIGPLQIDGENFLSYMVAAQFGTFGVITLFAFNFATKEWYKFIIQAANNNAGLAIVAINSLITNNFLNNLFLITNTLPSNFQGWQLPVQSGAANSIPSTIVFPTEEIKILRDITIDAIIIFYNAVALGSGTLTGTFTINGTQFTIMNAASCTFDQTWRYVILYPIEQCFTGTSPQLTAILKNTGSEVSPFYIGKVVLLGSMDSRQRPA